MTTIADDPPGAEGLPVSASGRAPAPGPGTHPGAGTAGPAAEGSDAEMAARLRLAILRLSRRLRQQVGGGVTSSQVSALATVERLGTPTLGELAASEQVQPPSMTKIVVALEAAGLVARQEEETDRRIVRVKLTAEGRRTLAAKPFVAQRLPRPPPAPALR